MAGFLVFHNPLQHVCPSEVTLSKSGPKKPTNPQLEVCFSRNPFYLPAVHFLQTIGIKEIKKKDLKIHKIYELKHEEMVHSIYLESRNSKLRMTSHFS